MSSEFRNHRIGVAAVVFATLFWSTSGLFVRWIEADLFTMLFWRGLFSGAGVFAFYFLMEGARGWGLLKRLGWPGVIVMLGSALSMITGTGAIRYTTAADALSIYATLPFLAAGAAWAVNGERPARSTMIASAVAFLGVLVMVKDAGLDGSLFGKVLAVFMTLGMVVVTTVIRRHRDVPMVPALGASAFLCSAVSAGILLARGGAGFAISPGDLALCAAFGLIQNAMGLSLYAMGSRHLRSSEAALLAALEVPLTPLWVWLLLSEIPANATLIGGGIVIAAMLGHMLWQLHADRSRPPFPLVGEEQPTPPPPPYPRRPPRAA